MRTTIIPNRQPHRAPAARDAAGALRELPDATWLPDFTSRYFTEDIVGTRAIQSLARRYAIPTPTIDALISQISTLSSETGALA